MCPVSLTFNPDHSRTLDRPVRHIDVHTGSLIVTATDDPVLIPAEEGKSFDDAASLTLYSPASARVTVVYSDEPDEPEEARERPPRGDSGGSGGAYESRTRDELRKLAKERQIPGYSRLSKNALIEALRS